MSDANHEGVADTMAAAVFDQYGPPEVLRLQRLPIPVPDAGEIVVRVVASSINGGELAARRGALRLITGRKFPKRTGVDFVGTVSSTGSGVDPDMAGAQVWGVMDERGETGSHAEYVVTARDRVAVAPTNVTPAEAVSMLAGGITALHGLRDLASLRRRERLLVRGAAGGVGSIAVQVGKMLGAHVTALASPRTADVLTGLGADEVIDYHTPLETLGKYDVVFDTRGTELRQLRRLQAPQGRFVAIAFDIDRPFRSLAFVAASVVYGARRVRLFFGRPTAAALTELARLVESGSIRPVIDGLYPLPRIGEAHSRLERGGVIGKLVITDR